MQLNIMLLAKLTPPGGNTTTAERIRSYLVQHAGHTCQIQDTSMLRDVESFTDYLAQHNTNCIIGVHLLHAGKFLIDCSLPFVIIFGGTDINEFHKENDKLRIMTHVVHQARKLVAFSDAMACQAMQLWPDVGPKIIIQPQAVCTRPSMFSEKNMIDRMKEFASPEDQIRLENLVEGTMVLFLLVAGLRPIKDPMFLFKAMTEWHKEDDKVYLVVVGAEIDPEYSQEVQNMATHCPGVLVLPALDQPDLHAVIKNCTMAVVNTSLSEGMAAAILEAMDLGTVVLARNNTGNATLIQHNHNGLLFNSPQEFLLLAKELVGSTKNQRGYLTFCAKEFIRKHHCTEIEIRTYCSIIQDIENQCTV